MSTLSPAPEVIVASTGVDACLVRNDATGALVVSPDQTFTSAVAASHQVLRGWSQASVADLLRPHLDPTEVDFDQLLPGHSTRWADRACAFGQRRDIWIAALLGVVSATLVTGALMYAVLGYCC